MSKIEIYDNTPIKRTDVDELDDALIRLIRVLQEKNITLKAITVDHPITYSGAQLSSMYGVQVRVGR